MTDRPLSPEVAQLHTRTALLLVVALAAGVALVGCKKAPAPEGSAAPAAPAAPAPREHATKAPTETMSGPNGEQGGRSGGESGPGRFRMTAEPLKTASGEAVTLFGPAGTAALRMFVRGDAVVVGDNTKGVLRSKSRDGVETSLPYEAAAHTAESLGAAAPDGLQPSSAFTLRGSVSEESVRATLERQARMGGESQPKVSVTADDCKITVDVAVYLVDGTPKEVADKWAAAASGGMDVVARGEDSAMCQSKADPRILISVTKAPDTESKLQVTVLHAVELPKSLAGMIDSRQFMAQRGPGGGGQRGMGGQGGGMGGPPGGGMGGPGGGQRGMGGQGGGQGRPGGPQGGNGGGGR